MASLTRSVTCCCMLLIFVSMVACQLATINISSFNIQVLGTTKIGKPGMLDDLAKIISRYDLLLVQELRDDSGTVAAALLNQINTGRASNNRFAMVVSDRLGRTASKEQYIYFYRTKVLQLEDSYVPNDPSDKFEREPYSALWTIRANQFKFFTVGIHVTPDDVVNELNALVKSFEDAATRFGQQNAVLMGDFNADCSYLSKTQLAALTLRKDTRFTWLIDGIDTTTKNSVCCYDRFIVTGIMKDIVTGTPGIYDFRKDLGITSLAETTAISDHFPIQFTISPNVKTSSKSCGTKRLTCSYAGNKPNILCTAPHCPFCTACTLK